MTHCSESPSSAPSRDQSAAPCPIFLQTCIHRVGRACQCLQSSRLPSSLAELPPIWHQSPAEVPAHCESRQARRLEFREECVDGITCRHSRSRKWLKLSEWV